MDENLAQLIKKGRNTKKIIISKSSHEMKDHRNNAEIIVIKKPEELKRRTENKNYQVKFRFNEIDNKLKKVSRKCKKCASDECYRCPIHEEKSKLLQEKRDEYRKIGLLQMGNGSFPNQKKPYLY